MAIIIIGGIIIAVIVYCLGQKAYEYAEELRAHTKNANKVEKQNKGAKPSACIPDKMTAVEFQYYTEKGIISEWQVKN